MNVTEYLTQPIVEPPEFPAVLLCLLTIFAVSLGYCAWTDHKKGVLLPNRKYWLLPGVTALAVLIIRAPLMPYTTPTAELSDLIICIIACLMYYVTAYRGIMGGADFWGCSLCTIMLCFGLGWPAFLVWIFIALVFIPAVCRTVARVKWCYQQTGSCTWEAWKKSNWGVLKSYRLLPALFAGYVGAVLVYVGAWVL